MPFPPTGKNQQLIRRIFGGPPRKTQVEHKSIIQNGSKRSAVNVRRYLKTCENVPEFVRIENEMLDIGSKQSPEWMVR